MKIILIRHFKVNYSWKNFYKSTEYQKACAEYDLAGIIDSGLRINPEYKIIASSLTRAVETSQLISGQTPDIISDSLVEVPINPFITSKVKLPLILWAIVGRVQWRFGSKRQPESYNESKLRINNFIDSLLVKNENVIIVSHGWTMKLIINHLVKRNFNGTRPIFIKTGTPLIFSN